MSARLIAAAKAALEAARKNNRYCYMQCGHGKKYNEPPEYGDLWHALQVAEAELEPLDEQARAIIDRDLRESTYSDTLSMLKPHHVDHRLVLDSTFAVRVEASDSSRVQLHTWMAQYLRRVADYIESKGKAED